MLRDGLQHPLNSQSLLFTCLFSSGFPSTLACLGTEPRCLTLPRGYGFPDLSLNAAQGKHHHSQPTYVKPHDSTRTFKSACSFRQASHVRVDRKCASHRSLPLALAIYA
ncbi:hypothetical protein QBC46DRAFT_382879 [Diplogelasinospora grovesii]|uniref:Uncharacterized protein n=1 Tax=Diplogelasinospora grovesii TaxID=303347 RepID=A0AAN6S607_9PEZI|nr:hypothetical protein QBC46DRAFT_382879 [Diplogelasinospora grovesii]